MIMRNQSAFCSDCMNKGVHRYHDSNIELVEKSSGRIEKNLMKNYYSYNPKVFIW